MSRIAILSWLGSISICIGGIAWCSSNTKHCIETCRFFDKKFVAAHDNEWIELHCATYNDHGACSFRIPITHTDHIPDKMYVTWIDALSSKHEEEVGETIYNNPPESIKHTHLRWKSCIITDEDFR